MSLSLPFLQAAYDRCVAFAEQAREASMDEHVSDFWREILEGRVNYPSFNEMLVMRRGFTYPIADRGKAGDLDAERAYARGAWDVVGRTVPVDYFDRFAESAVGAPTAFTFECHALTAGGIVNALTSYRVVEACQRLGLAERPLRVLEIGAGYGQMAHQLLQQLDIVTYAVCDLPENAFLTAFYLQANHPERETLFVGEWPAGAQPGLAFTIPPYLDRLEGPFDLIVNAYSFQEMTLDSVREYVAFAAERLAPHGLLYSLNSHAKAGVKRPSDYEVERFDVEALSCPRRFPWQPNGTVPYELVLRPRTAPPLARDGVQRRRSHLDALGGAMQLGLSDELIELIAAFVDGEEGAPHEGLDALATAWTGDEDARREAARRLPAPLCDYLAGIFGFLVGGDDDARRDLATALDALPATHAHVWALAVLGGLATVAGEHREAAAHAAEAGRIAPHLAADVARLVGTPDTARAMLASRAAFKPTPDRERTRE